MKLLPYGEDAIIVDLPDLAHVVGLAAAMRTEALAGVVDVVPGARSVLVRFDATATDAATLVEAVRAMPYEPGLHGDAGLVEVPVRYDGEDLGWVAEHAGLTLDEVVARHSGREYVVAFCGFAPGFGYCAGGDPALHVPRLASPRPRVPAGAVGLAGEWTAVYPRSSPGGWRLIGRTSLSMWDSTRDQPALLSPGTRVRFHPEPAR